MGERACHTGVATVRLTARSFCDVPYSEFCRTETYR